MPPQRGKRHNRKQPSSYDPESGLPYRTTITFDAFEAVKLQRAAKVADMSVAGLIAAAVLHMPVDEVGCPTWARQDHDESNQLPMTG